MKNKTMGLPYVPDFKHVLSAEGFISIHGELVKLSLGDKAVWKVLYDRFNYFKTEGLDYFESMDGISKQCAISKSGIKKCIDKFILHGVIQYERVKGNYQQDKYLYKSISMLNTYRVESGQVVNLYEKALKCRKESVDTDREIDENVPEEIYVPENIRWQEEDLEDPLDSFY